MRALRHVAVRMRTCIRVGRAPLCVLLHRNISVPANGVSPVSPASRHASPTSAPPAPPRPMTTVDYISARDAIAYLVSRGGNVDLAALDASRQVGHAITAAYFISIIASDPYAPSIIAQQLRMLALIQTFDAVRAVHGAFLQRIDDLAPRDLARAYGDLLNQLSSLTAAPLTASAGSASGGGAGSNVIDSTFEAVKHALPPAIADAVEFFIQHPDAAPDATDAHDANRT